MRVDKIGDKYKAVIFDMDGTLVNTIEDVTESVNKTLEKYGFPPQTKEQIASYMGDGVRDLMNRSCCGKRIAANMPPQCDQDTLDKLIKGQAEYYNAHPCVYTTVYPQAQKLLDECKAKHLKIGVATNKQEVTTITIINMLMPENIDAYCGMKVGMRPKPQPDILLSTVRQLGIKIEDCLYVGDSKQDRMISERVGMDFMPVYWGYGNPDEK